jgi:hypothetical protein
MAALGVVLIALTIVGIVSFLDSDFLIAMGWIDALLLIAGLCVNRTLKWRGGDSRQ